MTDNDATPQPAVEWGPFGLVTADPDYTAPPASQNRQGRAAETFHTNLVDVLLALVPLSIAEIRTWSDHRRNITRQKAVDTIAAHGDDLQFGGRQRGSALGALAQGIALGAYAPGGVTQLGIHACTRPHTGCPGLVSRGEPRGAA
ncbi:hypothetical protein [Nocardia salmonicida]|uniref:hypothetical protein n=1 Tax=Nocardia salmonicida TaxID=53431 RepID=UPI0007A4D33A|nr:hypothetical protein [Nocardia salmonicida]MBC7299827.1 hypothetical protein [Nocardia sp.]